MRYRNEPYELLQAKVNGFTTVEVDHGVDQYAGAHFAPSEGEGPGGFWASRLNVLLLALMPSFTPFESR